MHFDFRRGRLRWPGNVELIDPAKGSEMTDEARKEVPVPRRRSLASISLVFVLRRRRA
jgi:hypothetical protein